MSTQDKPYVMSIDLNVLNHLGIGLYSNIPAVLSEIVANAWDADATEVHIDIGDEQITIRDNGIGMLPDDINNKYLRVGYSKRTTEPGPTKILGRAPMGRKGIGKLSVFSIADMVEVQTRKDNISSGLLMNVSDIKAKIGGGDGEDYNPIPIPANDMQDGTGTLIKLSGLKKQINRTEPHLRRRLARRFSVIGAQHNFRVSIDGTEVTIQDRDYLSTVEFIWHFGDASAEVAEIRKQRQCFQLNNIVNADAGYVITGWLGTVDERKRFVDETANSVILLARGKLILENVLSEFSEGGIYAKYLIGEINAEFMDDDDLEDIVTSDRQRVKIDDQRYKDLMEFIWDSMKRIQNEWTELRNSTGSARALSIPAINEWYNGLTKDNQKYAKKLFGRIESMRIDDMRTKCELYRMSVLAFSKLALTGHLTMLDDITTDEGLHALLAAFGSIDEIEAVHYAEIARGRLEVIKSFERLVDANQKERVLQGYLFEHLWLLDPSWERAVGSERLEQSIATEFKELEDLLSEEERSGRVDIRYCTTAGKHMIVELKKYDVKVSAFVLGEQVARYSTSLEKVLRGKFPDKANFPIEIICVLGAPPTGLSPEKAEAVLDEINARYVTYDQLISSAQQAYREYLAQDTKMSKINEVLDGLDAHFGTQDASQQIGVATGTAVALPD